MKTSLILASGSPRRAEILQNIGATFEVYITHADETVEEPLFPDALVRELSNRKATEAALRFPDSTLILAADTVVALDGQIMGKPKDEAQAFDMLSRLSGRAHSVYTGYTLTRGGVYVSEAVKTDVVFYPLSEDLIYRYIKSGEPIDKAGAYGIQEKGSVLVKELRGDYFNVMGLPIASVVQTAKECFDADILGF